MPDEKQLQLYSTFVDTITAAEQRRQNASAIYFALLSAAIAFWGSNQQVDPVYIAIPVSVGSLLWLSKLLYFKSLAKAKFEVIKEFEKDWPFKPFGCEWDFFKSGGNNWLRISLTTLELIIPLVFLIASLVYMLGRLLFYIFG